MHPDQKKKLLRKLLAEFGFEYKVGSKKELWLAGVRGFSSPSFVANVRDEFDAVDTARPLMNQVDREKFTNKLVKIQ